MQVVFGRLAYLLVLLLVSGTSIANAQIAQESTEQTLQRQGVPAELIKPLGQKLRAIGFSELPRGGKVVFGSGGVESSQPIAEFPASENDALVNKGLQYLVDAQKADGSFPDEGVSASHRRGIVAVSVLAWLWSGEDTYHESARRGLDFLNQSAFPDPGMRGKFLNYDDAVTLNALVEGARVFGDKYRSKAELAVKTFVERQVENGAWSYSPGHYETCIVSLALMGLNSARQLKYEEVSQETIDKGIEFLYGQYDSRVHAFDNFSKNSPTYGATGIAVATLQRLGDYSTPEVRGGLGKLKSISVKSSTKDLKGQQFSGYSRGKYHFEMFTHALALRMSKRKHLLADWLLEVRHALADQVNEDGAWEGWFGHPYGTALTCMVLQMDRPAKIQLLKRERVSLAMFTDKSGIAWQPSFETALAVARKENRILMIKPVSIHLHCNDSW